RITTNKYVQTRWGIFELKHFFSSSLRNSEGGDDHSARNIKDRIARLVSEETNPLSDQEIVHILKKEGVEIARRTVAKYRKILRILPADRRKKLQGLKQKNQPAEKARS
ncbi:MAG: RNA polymerase sigma-54 factor, partial [Leptospirales bacterium]|nr:RNA polymerase sigma-54 factor [Leptospirales bacterium]